MEPSGLNPQANPAVNQQNLTTPGMPAGRGAPGIPGSMPLFLQGGGASSIGWQYPAATGIAVGTSPIKRPTLLSGCSTSTVNATREDSTPRAALPGPMSGTSEQDAGSSIRQSSFLPAGCTQVPISILVFHRHRTGRGPVPRPPLSHTPIPASEGGFLDSEDAASIQSAPSDFLSLGRASNVAASGMAMNPSALAAPVNCDSELPPVNAEAPQTGMQAKDSQLSSSSLSEVVCDSHSRSESAFPANTEETEGQLLAEGVTDHNMHTPARKAKPRRKKHRAKVIREDKQRKKENPTVTTPEVKSPSQKAKRSYVRKKRSLSSLEKFSGHVNDQSISEVPENATRSRTASVRRRLQFEFGEQGAQGNQSSTGNSCHHVKEKLIQAKSSSCSATTILSTAKIGHGLHGDMENSAGGLSFGMSTPKATQEISPATSRCCNREPTREQDNVGSTHDLDITSMGVTITEENWELEVNYPKKHGFDMHRIPEMASTESQVTKVSKVEKKEHRQHREREPSLTDSQDSIILRTAAQMLAFCEAEAGVVKKKRSVRARRTFPTMNIEKNNAQKRTRLRQPCMEALCESPYIKFVTKKRSPNMHKKKMFSSGNSFPGGSIGSDGKFQKTLLQAPNRTTNLDICYEAPEDASSAPYMNFVPRVASRQEYLNLNTQHVHTNEMSLTTSAVVPFGATGGLSNSLVPFGGQMIFPYERPLHFDKKQRPRAKVNLDFETTRVWNLLMGKAAEPDGTDVGKERWWQQEREVFQGRANSFIARMRLVQGDRHFSPWKGSVVDSVVGVFLTQNVSDHLSSSAYMALAASFPPGLVNSNCKDDVTTKELECQRIKTTAVNDDGVGEHVMYYPFISVDRQQPDVTNEPCVSPTSPNSSLDSASSLLKNGTTGEKLPLFMPSDNHTSQSNCSKTVISTWNSPKTSTDLPVELHCDKSTRFEASDLQEHESLSATGGMIAETANGVDGFTSESGFTSYSGVPDKAAQASSPKKTRTSNKKDTEDIDWDKFRRQACDNGQMKERIFERRDSVDWEAVRCADVHRISHAIRERGMNNILAQRIQSFLNRLVIDHGSIDLEWLRDIPPDSAKYPVLETVQKYLWPRLCKLDQDTLYELHYHMITFGKVFCTKSKPNCNACPLRSECRHFASAFASARLALPAPEEKSLVYSSNEFNFQNGGMPTPNSTVLLQLEGSTHGRDFLANNLEPIIEEPASPREEELPESFEDDIEDYDADTGEIPIIKLNFEAFVQSLENCTKESNMDLRADDIAKALVTISTEAASIPVPKLKNVRRLRTEHYVYELPDSHPLVQKIGLDQREPDDPSPYLLTIWMQDGIKETSKEPKPCCDSQMEAGFCNNRNCQYCVPEQDIQSRYVRGTILVPCRTAMKGSFPLNGTYFQVNEVFADHKSSHDPIDVARDDLWNLQRRMVYFGTSVPSIFKGLTTEEVQQCFWRGFVCVRGFDMQTRAPRPLCPHMHLAASKLPRSRKSEATEQNSDSARASVS